MTAPILNRNKASKMEVAEISEKFELENGDVRFRITFNKKSFDAIPVVGTIYKKGDKVICLFQDYNVQDTPFIIGKYNQKSFEEEKLISQVKPIEQKKDTDSYVQENDNSIIRMDDKRKRITIQNKNSPNSSITIDNDQVFIGRTNLTSLIENISEFKQKQANDEIIKSERNLNFKVDDGQFFVNAQSFSSTTNNFSIQNNNEMKIETRHINFSSSFIEFNAITPKGYDLKEKNAFSFFAVSGNYAISLGTGDFNLKAVSPLSEFNFLISPLSPFSGVGSSLSGMTIASTEISMGVGLSSGYFNLSPTSMEGEILYGSSALTLDPISFGVKLGFGVTSLELSPLSFSVTIAGNKLTLSPSGLTVAIGNITATVGDVEALSGSYSLMMHQHPTAVPGGPSPPLPMPPVPA
jgi:hypothetical protein